MGQMNVRMEAISSENIHCTHRHFPIYFSHWQLFDTGLESPHRNGNKKSKTHDFQKGLQFNSISTDFRQNHFPSFEGKSVDHLSLFRIFKWYYFIEIFRYLLGEKGAIERVQWIANFDPRSFVFEIIWILNSIKIYWIEIICNLNGRKRLFLKYEVTSKFWCLEWGIFWAGEMWRFEDRN